MTKKGPSLAKRTRWRGTGAAIAAALVLQTLPQTGWSQERVQPSIVINHDVLNSLKTRPPQAAAAAAPLPALEQPPRSRLLVQPERRAAAPPPVEAPQPTRGRPAGLLARLAAQDATAAPAAASPDTAAPASPIVPAPPDSERGEQQGWTIYPPQLQPPPPPPAPDLASVPAAAPPPPDMAPALAPPPQQQEAALPPAPMPETPEAAAPQPAKSGKQPENRKSGDSAATAQVLFEAGSTALSDRAQEALAGLAARLAGDGHGRVTLKGYAAGEERAARRLSLSRAQAVRSFLVDKGVASTRIDVRPLGATFSEGPADRVDIVAASR